MINVVTIDDNKVDLDRINLILYQIKEVKLVGIFLIMFLLTKII